MAKTYYIDWDCGNNGNDGLSPETPKQFHDDIKLMPGDTVLFKRGNMLRDRCVCTNGSPEGLITYGAYGEGENPIFCGSYDASSPSDWVQESENIWKYAGTMRDQACNIIYNYGRSCARLRFSKDDLSLQGDFTDLDFHKNHQFSYSEEKQNWVENPPIEGYVRPIYIYSEKNPGEYYKHIEIAAYRCWALASAVYARFENLTFINSGIHGVTGQHDLHVHNCQFHYIGGAPFGSLAMQIRFGNGVESFQHPKNVSVTDCLFNNIFDSCITHQGFAGTTPAVNINYSNNLFMNYGMAAYEVRDHIPENACFNDNICINAGVGFSTKNEIMPRKSEIWPFDMGHHVFLWRIAYKTPGDAYLEIKRNVFYEAPEGAAIYSFILEEPEEQLIIDENTYYTSRKRMFNRFGEVNYKPEQFDEYVKITGKDKNSKFEKVDIRELVRQWHIKTGKGEISDEMLDFYGIDK